MSFLDEIKTDIAALEAKVSSFFTSTVEPTAEVVISDIEAVIATWAKQFESDFGKVALSAAVTVVNGFAVGGFGTVVQVAETVGNALLAQGLSIAESDAQTVILNAARTALTAAQASPNAIIAPSSPAPATETPNPTTPAA